MERDILKVSDVAGALGVTSSTIYRWIENGRIKAVRVGGTYRITGESMIDFIREVVKDGK